jgi:hypothetical protein
VFDSARAGLVYVLAQRPQKGAKVAKKAAKARRSSTSIQVDPNVRCERIYPVEDTKKQVADLKTVGFKLTRDQAIHLARVLLSVSQDWSEMEVTGYRFDKRKTDGTYHITVTSANG